MYLIRTIVLFSILSSVGLSQVGEINEIFSQKILTEEFNQENKIFPTLTGTDGKYAIIMDSLGYYGIGSGNTQHPILIGWENDLIDFELKVSIRLKDENDSFVLQKLQGQTGQIIGIILKYNPETQEALIFETNGVRQYRLSHLKSGKLRSLTGDWVFSENLIRNDRNEIMIRTYNNNYEFYINNKVEFKKNLERFHNELNTGKFGFYLGAKTQAMIDYFYLSTVKDYDGINKLFNLSEEDARILMEEKNQIEIKLKKEKADAVKELETVIKILEDQLKSSNKILDSMRIENEQYQPFRDIIHENGNFMYTLTKDLKEQMEKNKALHKENLTLMDSISFLIQKQDDFKLEYLRILDSMMEQNDTINNDN